MEGDDTSELETLDSELVMSFYDQYHADEISKVYGDIEKSRLYSDLEKSRLYEELDKPTDSTQVAAGHKGGLGPDVTTQPSQVWNLPDLLVGLDGIHRLHPFSQSPPLSTSNVISSPSSVIPSCNSILQSTSQLLQNSHSELSKSCQADLRHAFLFDNFRPSTDSLLEGLGILPPVHQTPVKSEPLHISLPNQQQQQQEQQEQQQYNDLDSLELEITPFELTNLKHEPGLCTLTSLSSLLSKSAESSGSVDPLIAQHCSLHLPPELMADQGIIIPGLRANFVATVDDITDHPLSVADSQNFLMSDPLKEEEEDILERPLELGSNPTYKRCHLCVRIFSTKANLSSHIRHVHLGEAKHSRVKSIPCPHCHKMFSRKGHMTEHVRTVHEGKKRIYKEVNCQHCGKTFRRKWGLNIHISSAHADVVSSLLKQ